MKPIRIPYFMTRLARWLHALHQAQPRFLLLWLSLVTAGTQAQPNSLSTPQLDAYWSIPTPTREANTLDLTQTGSLNQAELSLSGGQGNRLVLTQTDSQNLASATLLGSANRVQLQQQGPDNQLHLVLGGQDNQLSIRQDGGDTIFWQSLQQNHTRLDIIQKAGANTLTVDTSLTEAFSTGIAGLRIEQSGGATALVQQGKVIGQ